VLALLLITIILTISMSHGMLPKNHLQQNSAVSSSDNDLPLLSFFAPETTIERELASSLIYTFSGQTDNSINYIRLCLATDNTCGVCGPPFTLIMSGTPIPYATTAAGGTIHKIPPTSVAAYLLNHNLPSSATPYNIGMYVQSTDQVCSSLSQNCSTNVDSNQAPLCLNAAWNGTHVTLLTKTDNGNIQLQDPGTQYGYVADQNGIVYQCIMNETTSNGVFNACTATPSSSAPEWKPRAITFATTTAGSISNQYAYVADATDGHIYKCSLNTTGTVETFNTCGITPSSDEPVWSPQGITLATVNTTQYAYIADSGNAHLWQCALTGSGGIDGTSCITTPATGAPSWQPSGTAFTIVNQTQYAYVADRLSNVWQCPLQSGGTFTNSGCLSMSASSSAAFQTPLGVTFTTVANGTQYAYVPDGAAGSVWKCSLNVTNGSFASCSQQTPTSITEWTPSAIAFATVTGTQYAYVADEMGNTYQCTLNSSGALVTCVKTPASLTASAWTPVGIAFVATQYSVGGTVTGLSGTGLVLQNNLSDSLSVGANGSFAFGTLLSPGNAYGVSVLTQPSSPTQLCSVSNGSGLIGSANVNTIAVTCVSAPGAPTGLVAVGGNAQATVSFTAPASDGGSPITAYTVTPSPGGITATGASSPLTVTGLTNGTSYTFTATATNAAGTGVASSASNSVTPAATVPGAPTIGTATPGNAQATVSFTPPSSTGGSPITGYTVTSIPGGITATGASSPLTVTGLTNGTAYTFTATARNAVGTGTASSASNSVTPVTVPGAPTIGTATPGNAQATVSFTPPSSTGGAPITGYTVTSIPGGRTATGASSPLTVTGLTNGTVYTFTATARNAVGTGTASSASNSVTPAATVPGAPTIGTATPGNAQATVSFTPPSSTGGSPITGYTVTSIPGGLKATGASSPLTVTGLTNGTVYTFTATARNAVGTGTASSPSNSVTPATVPGAPTIGTATAGNTQATVSFTAPSSDGGSPITSYTVRSNSGRETTGTSSPLTVTGLTNGTPYTFTVTATNARGTGLPSLASSPAVRPIATLPGAPTIGIATAGSRQATVTFTAPSLTGGSAITSYTVTSSPGGITATGASSPLTVTGLTNGTAYTFTATATNTSGTGAASSSSNSVTPTPFVYVGNSAINSNSVSICPINADGSFGVCVNSGNTGTAFVSPQGLSINASGSIAYVANSNANNRVLYCPINANGLFGACQNTTGTFSAPRYIAFNRAGTFAYVTNSGTNTVSKCSININGSFGTCVDSGVSNIFNGPRGIIVNSSGSFAYVANSSNNTVSVCSIDASTSSFVACVNSGNTGVVFNTPRAISLNETGTFAYISNAGQSGTGANTVSVCPVNSSTGLFGACAYSGNSGVSFNVPQGIAINLAGTIAYVANQTTNIVLKCPIIAGTGLFGACSDSGGTSFSSPIGMSINN
jgi:trimeric autotransporter adhesin